MKKFFLLTLTLIPAILRAQSFKYTFKAHIGTATGKPAIAYLTHIEGGVVSTDSVHPVNGAFLFTGMLDHPTKATLLIKHWTSIARPKSYSDKIPVYLEKGVTMMETADSLKNAVFTDAPLNVDNQALLVMNWKAEDDAKAIMSKFYTLPAEKRKEPAIVAQMTDAQNIIAKEQKEVLARFIKSHPASFVSLNALKTMAGAVPDYDEAIKFFNILSPSLRNSDAGKAYAGQLANIKTTAIGSLAPDFVQNDVDGKPVKLSSFRGKYVLIDFWASWCGPCREENPNVLKAYHQYKDKNFTVLGVSLDKANDRDKWIKAIADDHLEWTQVSDLAFFKNAVAKKYGVTAIPQNFLLDPQGKIIGRDLRGKDLETKLAEIMK